MRNRLAACTVAIALACLLSAAAAEEGLDVTVINGTDRTLRIYWFDDDRIDAPVPPRRTGVTGSGYRAGSVTHMEIALADAPPRPEDFSDKCWVMFASAGAHSVHVRQGAGGLECAVSR